MSTFDDWDLVAPVFFVSILAGLALYALVRSVDRRNPFHHTRRNSDGRRRMATDWQRPRYLPESWQ